MRMPTPDPVIFSGPLGEITKTLDPYTEADPVGVHVSLLAAFSAYLGQTTRVQTGKGLSPLSFWTVLVGVTGQGRKGTATSLAQQVVEAAFTAWSTNGVVTGCPATGLGFITELYERTAEGAATPVLIIEEEMDAFISNSKKDTRVGTMLRKAWDGADLNHKTAKDDIHVAKPHVAIVGHVQPKNWGAISGSRDATGGTYNRFLPVAVTRSKTLPVFGAADSTEVIRDMARKLRRMASFAREVDVVRVRPDVAEIFEARHRPACEGLIHGNEELAQMAERAMAYLVRLAALYALTDSRDEIEEVDFDAALAVIRYSVETIVAVLPEAGGDLLTTKIAAAVRLHGVIDGGELWDLVGRNVSKRQITEALLATPQIQTLKGKSTGGRPPTLYQWVEDEANDEAEAEVSA